MQDLLERLAGILSQQLDLYNKLLLNLSDQRCTLPTGNTEDIHEILTQQENLTLELKALEEARLPLMEKLSQHLHEPTEQLTPVSYTHLTLPTKA